MRKPIITEVVSDVSWRWILRQTWEGCISRIKSLRHRHHSNRNIQEFFRKARGEEMDFGVIDLSSAVYAPLLADLEFLRQQPLRVIEIGSGGFTFHRLLKFRGFSINKYLAYDLIVGEEQIKYAKVNSIVLVEEDYIANVSEFSRSEANLIVAINSLCYIADIERFCQKCRLQGGDSSQLLIVEPVPSLLWEPCFEGVRITMRRLCVLVNCFETRGWFLTHSRVLYCRRIIGRHLLPISQLLVFEYRP